MMVQLQYNRKKHILPCMKTCELHQTIRRSLMKNASQLNLQSEHHHILAP